MEVKGDDVNISFLPVVPNTIRVKMKQVESTPADISPPDSSEKPVFGHRPDTQATDFDFEGRSTAPTFQIKFRGRSKIDMGSAKPVHRSHL